MKALNYLYLLLFISLFAACNDNDLETLQPQDTKEAIISISLDNILPINMNTRANTAPSAVPSPRNLSEILSYIQDLNIRVHFKGGKIINKENPLHIYCYEDYLVIGKPGGGSGNASYIGSSDLKNFNNNSTTAENKHIKLHLADITVNDIAYIEVIANAGQNLYGEDFNSIQENQSYAFAANGLCMMYGYADVSSGKVTHGENTCEQFNLTLKRTRALMTFVVNASGLKKGVEITPKVVRLRNLPDACNVTSLIPHTLPDGTQITPNKIESMDAVPSNPKKLYSVDVVREQYLNEVVLTNKAGSNTYGEHAYKGKDLPVKFFPLYMYENMQGVHGDASKEVTKYPAGISTVAEAKNRTKNYKYSYIELEADYKYKEANTVKISGTIIYRFFLGENSTNNFDIEGNHYYRLNLNLAGFGGASEDGKVDANGKLVVNDKDASWRVDMKTKDWGFEQNQFDFDSHHINGVTKVIGTNWKFSEVLKGDGSASWLSINVVNNGLGEWVNPTTIVEQKCKLNIVNGTLRFNLQPMVYLSKNGQLDPAGQFNETTYNQSVNYREMQIEVMNLDNGQKDTITVRQYAPIPVTVGGETFFMERFEEYKSDAVGWPWNFQDHNLSGFFDLNNAKATYMWGNPNKEGVGNNSSYLYKYELDKGVKFLEGQGSAASMCFAKGASGVIQGAEVTYYALPSEAMMKAMFEMAATYDKSWGPFEPMHMYEDYWTSTVQETTPTESTYYHFVDGKAKYLSTNKRMLKKRVRSVYTHQQGILIDGD